MVVTKVELTFILIILGAHSQRAKHEKQITVLYQDVDGGKNFNFFTFILGTGEPIPIIPEEKK